MLNAVRPVRQPGAKSGMRQIWEVLHWGSRLMTTPNDYRTHRLYMSGVGRREARRFLSGPRGQHLIWPLNTAPHILEDKLAYEAHFGAAGLPVPETLAVIAAEPDALGRRTLSNRDQVREFLVDTASTGQGLAVKPLDAWEGEGVQIIVGVDGGEFILSNGERQSIDGVLDVTSTGVWIVQKRIVQHAELDAFNASTLNTLRLGTFRRRDGKVDIVFAVLRIGRAHSQIDAYNHGGYSIRIDPETGAFADHAFQKAKFSNDLAPTHADSGTPFAGRQYPFWDDVVAKAKGFAAAAGENVFVGWDVSVTPTGPVFVEGNHNWDVQLAQIGSKGMLTDDFVALLKTETGVKIDPHRMPPLRPLRALSVLRG